MEYTIRLEEVKKGKVAPAYLLHGPEELLQSEFIAALREQLFPDGEGEEFNYAELSDQASLREALELVDTPTLFGGTRLVVFKPAAVEEEMAEAIGRWYRGAAPGACLVVAPESPLDGRSKAFRQLTGSVAIVDCQQLRGDALIQWVRARAAGRGKHLAPRTAWLLTQRVGDDLRRLDSEIDKLAIYLGQSAEIDAATVELLVARSVEEKTYQLTDAIGDGHGDRALAVYRSLLVSGQSPLQVIAAIAWQLRLLLKARVLIERGLDTESVVKELKAHPYVARKACERARRLERAVLREAFSTLAQAELCIKRGQLPEELAVEMAILKLAGS